MVLHRRAKLEGQLSTKPPALVGGTCTFCLYIYVPSNNNGGVWWKLWITSVIGGTELWKSRGRFAA